MKYKDEVEDNFRALERLKTNPAFASEIERLSEIVPPTAEDLIIIRNFR